MTQSRYLLSLMDDRKTANMPYLGFARALNSVNYRYRGYEMQAYGANSFAIL